MSTIFFIADTHFGHKRVLEFEPDARPFSCIEEHDEALIDNWNRVVAKRDTVWHLGDVVFGARNIPLLDRLKGNKKLVMGNHDNAPVLTYAQYFTRICGSMELRRHSKKILLTHIPVSPTQSTRYDLNIHGHTHSKRVMRFSATGMMLSVPDPFYIPVSVEHTNLTPIPFDELLS